MGRQRKNKDNNIFKVRQMQPSNEVTGSAMLVECDGRLILVDYGMFQANDVDIEKVYDINREKLKLPIDKITDVILTHSHADHVGSLGVLGRSDIEFSGKIYATELCAALTKPILLDSAHIMDGDTKRYNINNPTKKKLTPLYNKDDVESVIYNIRCYGYEEKIWLTDNLYFEFLPSGHLPASSMIYLVYENVNTKVKKRLLITGDFYYGKDKRPFTKSVLDKCLKANCIVTESTYGNRYHNRENPIDVLEKAIMDYLVNDNKILFIPCFGQHRSTVLYHYLDIIYKRNKEIADKNVPVYFCSKLLEECHKIIGMNQYKEFYDEEWQELDHLFNGAGFKFIKQGIDVEKFILNNTKKIVIASSGMISGGFSNMIAKSFIPNNKVVMAFCGYQGEQTIGNLVLNGAKEVTMDGITKKVRCKHIGVLPNMSCHADLNGIVDFIKSCNQNVLRTVLITHGGEEERLNLKNELENKLGDKVEVKIFNQYDTFKF